MLLLSLHTATQHKQSSNGKQRKETLIRFSEGGGEEFSRKLQQGRADTTRLLSTHHCASAAAQSLAQPLQQLQWDFLERLKPQTLRNQYV